VVELRLSSGPPWYLVCDVEQVGDECVCRIHRGDRRVGAVALSRWRSNRATTECRTFSGNTERSIAVHAAHTLSTASRGRVTCIAGIHFDSPGESEPEAVAQAAHALARQAARKLESQRFEHALQAPGCELARIEARTSVLSREVEAFLALPRAEAMEAAGPAVAAALAGNFDNRVGLFAPLYLCSACSNDCVYCGFRRSARFARTRLSIDQAVQEAEHLAALGHRTIDLVTGEIATDRFVDYVCETTRRILEATGIRRINLNLGALSTKQFRRLKAAGACGYHLYQETYAPQTYFEVHERGLKRDMAYRLNGPHRAAAAGFESIGLGILLGLHPIHEDLAALAAHAQILMEDFPRLRLGFSLPRLQNVDAACEYTARTVIGDDDFARAMLFLRTRFPQANLTLTTRERPEIRDRLVSLGVTKASAGVSTAPGGYALDRPGAAQFDISDRRPLPAIVELLRRSGVTATYE